MQWQCRDECPYLYAYLLFLIPTLILSFFFYHTYIMVHFVKCFYYLLVLVILPSWGMLLIILSKRVMCVLCYVGMWFKFLFLQSQSPTVTRSMTGWSHNKTCSQSSGIAEIRFIALVSHYIAMTTNTRDISLPSQALSLRCIPLSSRYSTAVLTPTCLYTATRQQWDLSSFYCVLNVFLIIVIGSKTQEP